MLKIRLLPCLHFVKQNPVNLWGNMCVYVRWLWLSRVFELSWWGERLYHHSLGPTSCSGSNAHTRSQSLSWAIILHYAFHHEIHQGSVPALPKHLPSTKQMPQCLHAATPSCTILCAAPRHNPSNRSFPRMSKPSSTSTWWFTSGGVSIAVVALSLCFVKACNVFCSYLLFWGSNTYIIIITHPCWILFSVR